MPLPPDFVPPCIPTLAAKPPAGLGWIHEVKHDGYRLQARRDGDAVRFHTRRGYDWTDRYPAIFGQWARGFQQAPLSESILGAGLKSWSCQIAF